MLKPISRWRARHEGIKVFCYVSNPLTLITLTVSLLVVGVPKEQVDNRGFNPINCF